MTGWRELVGGVAAVAGVVMIVVFGLPGAAVVFVVALVVAVVRRGLHGG